MTLSRLLRRSLAFHRRSNIAILLGVTVGTAVLTGALLVGDSLRGSLRDRALRQLGWVEEAMVSGRFVRQWIAKELDDHVIYGITLGATAERAGDNESGPRVTGVTVWATKGDVLIPSLRPTPAFHESILERAKRFLGMNNQALVNQAEDLRKAAEDWRRIWMTAVSPGHAGVGAKMARASALRMVIRSPSGSRNRPPSRGKACSAAVGARTPPSN